MYIIYSYICVCLVVMDAGQLVATRLSVMKLCRKNIINSGEYELWKVEYYLWL